MITPRQNDCLKRKQGWHDIRTVHAARDGFRAVHATSKAKKLCTIVHRAVEIDPANDLACHLHAEIFPRGNELQGKVGGIMDEERNLWREYECYKQELLTMDIDPQTFAALCRAKAKELGL